MTTFDFQDGDGPVPAHQHPNGGGWVANTAKVTDTAYVGSDAVVSGSAQVFGNAVVSGNAVVCGYAQVYGDAVVSGTLLTANRSDGYTFAIFKCQDGQTRITAGCRYFTIPEAINHWTNTRGGTRLGKESIMLVNHLQNIFQLQE